MHKMSEALTEALHASQQMQKDPRCTRLERFNLQTQELFLKRMISATKRIERFTIEQQMKKK